MLHRLPVAADEIEGRTVLPGIGQHGVHSGSVRVGEADVKSCHVLHGGIVRRSLVDALAEGRRIRRVGERLLCHGEGGPVPFNGCQGCVHAVERGARHESDDASWRVVAEGPEDIHRKESLRVGTAHVFVLCLLAHLGGLFAKGVCPIGLLLGQCVVDAGGLPVLALLFVDAGQCLGD